MILVAGLLLTLIGALVALYSSRPRFRRRVVSAWQFLDRVPEAKGHPLRLAFNRPKLSTRFWLQLSVLVLALAAVLSVALDIAYGPRERLGVWLLVDTSYSMTTRHGDVTRMGLARQQARAVVARTLAGPNGADPCLRLAAFDVGRRDIATSVIESEMMLAIDNLAVQPAGTDLGIVRRAMAAPVGEGCPITHVVVISDRSRPEPVPLDRTAGGARRLIWLSVGQAARNFGLIDISADRDPFSGRVAVVTATVQAWGTVAEYPGVAVTAPEGGAVRVERLTTAGNGPPWRVRFVPEAPGDYRIAIPADDAYDGDDHAILTIAAVDEATGEAGPLPVDWQLDDRSLADGLGWAASGTRSPVLRVVGDAAIDRWSASADGPPLLVVGSGYGSMHPTPVGSFLEQHPVRDLVNLDVLEQSGASTLRLPAEWTIALADENGRAWVGVRERPRAVRIPGLPSGGDGPVDLLSATLFFNALNWLFDTAATSLAVTWTTPDGTPILQGETEWVVERGEAAQHRDEGLDSLSPITGEPGGAPIWPWLVVAASGLFAVERAMAARWASAS